MPLFQRFRKSMGRGHPTSRGMDADSSSDSEDEVEITDQSATELSYVGTAAYDVLRKKHGKFHKELWNVSKGKIMDLTFTPRDAFTRTDSTNPPVGHSDWLPQKLEEIISKTERWCDILSLGPPDGLFLTAFQQGLKNICHNVTDTDKKVIIRIMFGNLPTRPINITKVMEELTAKLPHNAPTKIKLWVGAWRKGQSWNHAKIIAVDGKHLVTGGHNLLDSHYLKANPTQDLSIVIDGHVARDGHRFANAEWGYIVKKQNTAWGNFVDKRIPDGLEVPRTARVAVSNYPEHATNVFPPMYSMKKYQRAAIRNSIIPDEELSPIITMGRYGAILKTKRPSDDAFIAMFHAAEHSIRCALQDLGPVCVPHTKLAAPGTGWPTNNLNALAYVMWTKGVDVEIVLSNPVSIPNPPQPIGNQYGNGWECVDVASELIKCIKGQFPTALDSKLREVVEDNLRVCYLKCPRGGSYYSDGGTLGLHSKYFIIDDRTCYIGSQNLYKCDLAEWGVVIDDIAAVTSIKNQYWDPMWQVSYTQCDCDVDQVMDGLDIRRHSVAEAAHDSESDSDAEDEDDDDDDDDDEVQSRSIEPGQQPPPDDFDPTSKPPSYWVHQRGKKVRNPEHIAFMKKKHSK